MISVVLSSLNPGRKGYKAVVSCLQSLPKDAEVVFHLDPSEDSQSSGLKSISDSRFRLISTSERIGFAKGLNLAITEAKFNLIARLDADDLAVPWRWAYQAKAIRNVDFHFGSLLHLYEYQGLRLVLPHYPVRLSRTQFAALAALQNPGFHPAAMFKKDSFMELGGYRDSLSEDYDLWLRAALAGKAITRSRIPVTIYRHHPQQSTSSTEWEQRVNRDDLIVESRNRLRSSLGDDHIKGVLGQLFRDQPLAAIEFRNVKRSLGL